MMRSKKLRRLLLLHFPAYALTFSSVRSISREAILFTSQLYRCLKWKRKIITQKWANKYTACIHHMFSAPRICFKSIKLVLFYISGRRHIKEPDYIGLSFSNFLKGSQVKLLTYKYKNHTIVYIFPFQISEKTAVSRFF